MISTVLKVLRTLGWNLILTQVLNKGSGDVCIRGLQMFACVWNCLCVCCVSTAEEALIIHCIYSVS